MRRIKFRGKASEDYETSIDGVEEGDWVYGYLMVSQEREYMIFTVLQEECGGVGSGLVNCMIPVEPDTVGEYTGRKDKEGVEIYEGDIVKSGKEYNSYTGFSSTLYGGNIYQIKNNGWSFSLQPTKIYSPDYSDLEVIGNIYENKELLK